MALVEMASDQRPQPTARQIENRKNLKRGPGLGKRIKDGMRLNRLLRRDAGTVATELVRLATEAESEQVRASTGQYILNRAFGMPASAPEDQAAALAVAAAPAQFLMQLLNMRIAAQQNRIIDVASTTEQPILAAPAPAPDTVTD